MGTGRDVIIEKNLTAQKSDHQTLDIKLSYNMHLRIR